MRLIKWTKNKRELAGNCFNGVNRYPNRKSSIIIEKVEHPVRLLISTILAMVFLLNAGAMRSQENQKSYIADKLLVYLDSTLCPLDSLKQDISFAEFIPEKDKANVVIKILHEIRDGLNYFRIDFIGRKEFEGKNYSSELSQILGTEAKELEKELVRKIKLGLVPYAGRTPAVTRLKIKLKEEVKPTAVVDPWNFWVFSLSVNSFLSGQQSYSYQSVYGNFSANRITPNWKIRLSISGSFYRDSYEYEGTSYISTSQGQSFQGLVARSLGEHWSIGAFATVMTSTYQNLRFKTRLSPAIEYNIFPYSQSTKRQLRIAYSIGLGPAYYREETIFDKTREFLLNETGSITMELKKKWGTISTSVEGSHYFHDFSKYRLEFNTDLSIRVFKGFSFNVYGSYARIHDLISIAKAGASWEDVLLLRKQLATSYDYYLSVGISYSFGSIFSNVVNPRFGSGTSGVSIRMSY